MRETVIAEAVRTAVLRVPGTKSAVYESQGGETRLEFAPDQAALARYKVDPALLRATADLFLSGGRLVAPDIIAPAAESAGPA